MKKFTVFAICLILLTGMLPMEFAFAREGDAGYEGGISSGDAAGKTSYEYQEVCFLTGEPVVMKGTLIIKKQMKQDKITSTYTYNLKNIDKAATLTRVLSFTTAVTKKDNGQIIEESSYTKAPSETIKFGSTSYILKSGDFTRSSLVDPKPAINYYAGNIWGKKIYQAGTTASGGSIT
ncbi:MAG: S-layer homology domain-containing protein, partial [Ruminiclostridium sp.]|nr:S-layer homology domain-containing protein [Ruminiclostridium sp.]